jgi:hypothetical protein
MRIHTVGDSHCHCGWPAFVTPHHLGAMLCYSFGKEKLDRCDLRDLDIEDGDTVIFCFGEIDCRAHIHKHITEEITYQDIIDELVTNYFEAIELNITTSGLKLKNICVFNVVPPNQGGTKNHDWVGYSKPDEKRKSFVEYFNQQLKVKCEEYGYLFFDVYDEYVDSAGFLNRALSDNHMHIAMVGPLYQFMREHF